MEGMFTTSEDSDSSGDNENKNQNQQLQEQIESMEIEEPEPNYVIEEYNENDETESTVADWINVSIYTLNFF